MVNRGAGRLTRSGWSPRSQPAALSKRNAEAAMASLRQELVRDSVGEVEMLGSDTFL